VITHYSCKLLEKYHNRRGPVEKTNGWVMAIEKMFLKTGL
jgi:hypothetical protein